MTNGSENFFHEVPSSSEKATPEVFEFDDCFVIEEHANGKYTPVKVIEVTDEASASILVKKYLIAVLNNSLPGYTIRVRRVRCERVVSRNSIVLTLSSKE